MQIIADVSEIPERVQRALTLILNVVSKSRIRFPSFNSSCSSI